MAELHALLVAAEPLAGPAGEHAAAPLATSDELLLVPGGTLWHRADCPLVAGKPEALPADAHARAELSPCPICEPSANSPQEPPNSAHPSPGP